LDDGLIRSIASDKHHLDAHILGFIPRNDSDNSRDIDFNPTWMLQKLFMQHCKQATTDANEEKIIFHSYFLFFYIF
jgi:hypothetical protein